MLQGLASRQTQTQILDAHDKTSDLVITPSELRAAFDRIVLENVRPGAIGLASLYVLFTGAHLVLLAEPARSIMASLALFSAVLLFVFWLLLRRRAVPVGWTHPAVTGMAGIVLVNSAVHLYLTNTPRDKAI